MIEREAVVARTEGDQACVELIGEDSGCGRCHEAGGCRSELLTRMFRTGPRHFHVDNRVGAEPGERVVIQLADGATLGAALRAYLIPALFLLGGALMGAAIAGEEADAAAAIGALIGLAAGMLTGLRVGRQKDDARPAIVRRGYADCIQKEACR